MQESEEEEIDVDALLGRMTAIKTRGLGIHRHASTAVLVVAGESEDDRIPKRRSLFSSFSSLSSLGIQYLDFLKAVFGEDFTWESWRYAFLEAGAETAAYASVIAKEGGEQILEKAEEAKAILVKLKPIVDEVKMAIQTYVSKVDTTQANRRPSEPTPVVQNQLQELQSELARLREEMKKLTTTEQQSSSSSSQLMPNVNKKPSAPPPMATPYRGNGGCSSGAQPLPFNASMLQSVNLKKAVPIQKSADTVRKLPMDSMEAILKSALQKKFQNANAKDTSRLSLSPGSEIDNSLQDINMSPPPSVTSLSFTNERTGGGAGGVAVKRKNIGGGGGSRVNKDENASPSSWNV